MHSASKCEDMAPPKRPLKEKNKKKQRKKYANQLFESNFQFGT